MASRDASADALADRELGQARGVTSHAIGLDATTSEVAVTTPGPHPKTGRSDSTSSPAIDQVNAARARR